MRSRLKRTYDIEIASGMEKPRVQIFEFNQESLPRSGACLPAIMRWWRKLDQGKIPEIKAIIFRGEEFTDMTVEVYWSNAEVKK